MGRSNFEFLTNLRCRYELPLADLRREKHHRLPHPMVTDIDIWRTATYLIKNRDDAEMYAALRADELPAAGDAKGNIVWTRIGFAIRTFVHDQN